MAMGGEPAVGEALELHDLLNDAESLAGLLPGRVAAADRLDGFLVAAGLTQVLEDALHPDTLDLGRIASRLRRGVAAAPRRAAARAAATTAAAAWSLHVNDPRRASVERCRDDAMEITTALASRVLTGAGAGVADAALAAAAGLLRERVGELPRRVRTTPVRMPSCFRSFDQTPGDVDRLAGRVSDHWADRGRPVLVVGIRTSGCYLAPLVAAALRARGHERTAWTTVRPGQRWLPAERRAMTEAVAAGALAVVVDDPPISWRSVARGAGLLTALGFDAGSVVLALQTFATTPPPPDALRAHPSVLMPWGEWEVRARLEPAAVGEALAALLGDRTTIAGVRRVGPAGGDGRRGHVHARFEVETDGPAGRDRRELCVRGVGLGYLGSHAIAVSRALAGFLPAVHGVRDGLMFRDWVPEADRLTQDADDERFASAVAAYVHARSRALPAVHDHSRRLGRRATAHGRAAEVLSRSFGRAAAPAWPLCARALRPLLEVDTPSVVDGNTGRDAWFRGGRRGLVKVGADERAFGSLDLHSCDPVFDLAGAVDGGTPALADALRRRYGELSGTPVAAERWLLHQLVHLRERMPRHDPEAERRMSAAVQRYLGEVLLGDLSVPSAGALCAIDIDGVLEASPLGFSATGRAGARALRALIRHGRRPVLATGRSVDEVRERCRSYRLPGGVAEYGAAVYVAATGEIRELLDDADRKRLATLRDALAGLDGVELDPAYRHAVRAFRRDAAGRRRGLTSEQVTRALDVVAEPGRIRAFHGVAATDFMVGGVTKATGLQALARALGAALDGADGLALAVGDGVADLEMLRLAHLGCAPGSADPVLRGAGVRVLRRWFQAGLGDAVALHLGHRPGGCSVCREPRLPADARLLLALLGEPRAGSRAARVASGAIAVGRIAAATARTERR